MQNFYAKKSKAELAEQARYRKQLGVKATGTASGLVTTAGIVLMLTGGLPVFLVGGVMVGAGIGGTASTAT